MTQQPRTAPDLVGKTSLHSRRAFAFFPFFVILGIGVFWIDLPLARIVLNRQESLPTIVAKLLNEIHDILTWSEAFADAIGIVLISLGLLVILPNRRRQLLRVLVCAIGSGISADIVKLMIARMRPHSYNLSSLPDHVWQTFVGWFPLATLDDPFSSSIHSFPSGHTAAATGFAIGLIWLYPRGKWVFITLALLGGLQRVEIGAHYLSDVCFGAAVSCLFAGLCFNSRAIGRWFDRFELGHSDCVAGA